MQHRDARRRRRARRSSAAPATPARTGSSCCSTPTDAAARLGRSCSPPASTPVRARRPRHAAARGLLPPLRQRPGPGPQPDRGRARLVLQGGHRLRRLRGRRARRARAAPPRGSCRSRSPAAASRARATRSSPATRRSATVTSGTFSPSLEVGIGMAYVRADLAEPGTEIEIDVRGKRRAGARSAVEAALREEQLTQREGPMATRRATPRTCATTPSTTGRGSRATRPPSASPGTRRTRSARSSSSTRPRSARTVDQGRALRRGRVGQGGLRRDRAALAARSSRSTRRSATTPS